MLKELSIQNIALIESVTIPFEEGFNVLSGETGAGKSAILTSLALIIGERADRTVIRKGADKGRVQAIFTGISREVFYPLFEEGGIDWCEQEEIILCREVLASGKTRAYVNNQYVTVSFLKKIGLYLVKYVGQHASQALFSLEQHREMLDQYGSLDSILSAFQESFRTLRDIDEKIKQLKEKENDRERELEKTKRELEEIEEANIKPNEEQDIYEEYCKLSKAEEFEEKCTRIIALLSDHENAILSRLISEQDTLSEIEQIDSSLNGLSSSYTQAVVELKDIADVISHALGRFEVVPGRLQEVSERLSEIHRIQKKYGFDTDDITDYEEQLKRKVEELEHSDLVIQDLEKKRHDYLKKCDEYANDLTQKRVQAAKKLELDILPCLRDLNMPKAEFSVRITECLRSNYGDDKVEYFLAPNTGERQISVTASASGGELSRIMLALQSLLSENEKIPTIVFDEIDANIGGVTATTVGEKLQGIGKSVQVLAVTHFPQVASKADHHLQISKEEVEGRTLTFVEVLEEKARENELARMLGG